MTTPTQSITRPAASSCAASSCATALLRSGSIRGCPSRRWIQWRKTIDDRGAGLIDFDLRDERTNDLAALDPRQCLKLALYTCREALQVRRDRTQADGLMDLALDIDELTTCSLDACAQSIAPRRQIRELDGASFVRIDEPLERALMVRDDACEIVSLVAQICRDSITALTPRPFLENAFGALEQIAHRLPNVTVELIDPDLRVLADPPACEAMTVGTGATVIRVALTGLRALRGGQTVERVAALGADGQPLQEVALAARMALRQALVALELGLGRVEQLARDDGGNVDADPLLGSATAVSRLCLARHLALAANGTKGRSSFHRFGLTEGRFSRVRGVFEHPPNRRAIPIGRTSGRRYTFGVEHAHDLAARLLLARKRFEDAADDLRLVQKDAIACRSFVRFLHVEIPVRSSAQRIDEPLPSAMDLPAAGALEDLRSLVLRDHSLNLDEQLVLGRLALGSLKEDRRDAVFAKLIEQHDLVGVLAREAIGAVDVDDLDRSLGDAISQSLESGADERCPTEAIVHEDVLWQHHVTVGDRALLQRFDLAADVRLLCLMVGRDSRVDRDRFHRLAPRGRARLIICAPASTTAGSSSTVSWVDGVRSTTGIAISYAVRRWSSDKRVGANATRSVRARLAIEEQGEHTPANLSRKRQTLRGQRLRRRPSGTSFRRISRSTRVRQPKFAIALEAS